MDTWWDYVTKYDEFCIQSGDLEDCSRNEMADLKLDFVKIQMCVEDSFGDNEDTCTSNPVLDSDTLQMGQDQIFLFPSVNINGFTFRGNLVPIDGVYEALCESFNSMPPNCVRYFNQDRSTPGIIIAPNSEHASVLIAAGVLIILFGFFLFCCYRRYLKRELRSQMARDVQFAVGQYVEFKEDKEDSKLFR
mmetsp:Transcript_4730/g.3926  ORF Transcript_4730/g.3926 Transcript_4730/m.3926 type:complete len:191 (-) Transcript_4730:29-601(-)